MIIKCKVHVLVKVCLFQNVPALLGARWECLGPRGEESGARVRQLCYNPVCSRIGDAAIFIMKEQPKWSLDVLAIEVSSVSIFLELHGIRPLQAIITVDLRYPALFCRQFLTN